MNYLKLTDVIRCFRSDFFSFTIAILLKFFNMKLYTFCFVVFSFILSGCDPGFQHDSTVSEVIWGESGGKLVKLFTLTNKNGMVIKISNYGGTLTYVSVPDKNGKFEPVVLGFDSLKMYLGRHPSFGNTIGRFANRIGGAKFSLNGTTYKLSANNRGNSIHGGPNGFSRQVFDVDTAYAVSDSAVVVLTYLSHDMEEGFPGTLALQLTYVVTSDNEIILDYEVTTDKPTIVNLTNHSYFNLSGCKESVLNHTLMLAADSICPVDSNMIPTGILLPVSGTAYDFTQAHKIGDRIVEVAPGYDINYKLRKKEDELSLAAEVFDPESGRLLRAYTTEPGMQLYSANSDLSHLKGHNGIIYGTHYGVCLEMQHFPDSPNKPQFPDVVLEPDEKYRQLTIYKFSVAEL